VFKAATEHGNRGKDRDTMRRRSFGRGNMNADSRKIDWILVCWYLGQVGQSLLADFEYNAKMSAEARYRELSRLRLDASSRLCDARLVISY
jgi:hypothetical protein